MALRRAFPTRELAFFHSSLRKGRKNLSSLAQMISEQVVLSLFRSCLLAYLIGAALALTFTRRQRLANTFGFLSSCLGGLAGMAASCLCLQHGSSPAFDLLPFDNAAVSVCCEAGPVGSVLRLAHFAVGCGHFHLLHRLRGTLLRRSRMLAPWPPSLTCCCWPTHWCFAPATRSFFWWCGK